ncbi:ArsB/NhaD family transporter [Candidatus Azambacteria bacterium]|nr:ArsB/NhaD family transporter [Candidatus Azambacteria bacterium]
METVHIDTPFIISSVIAALTLGVIISEKLHRTIVAFLGAIIMMVAGVAFNFFSANDAFATVDLKTLGLLFGSMIMVAVLEETGVFQYLGILTAQKTKGNPWLLMVGLGFLTFSLSLFLNNVTTVMLVAPVAITIARILKISPIPLLISEAIMANIGGVGTLVGHPPNILIGYAAHISFNQFFIHAFPVAFASLIATLLMLKLIYKKELSRKPENIEELMRMRPKEAIVQPKIAMITLPVLAVVIILFFIQDKIGLDASVISLIGAALVLFLVNPKKDPKDVFAKIEVSLLLFFTSLFVIFGALEKTGVLDYLAQLIVSDAKENLLMTSVIIMWAGAFISAVIDNIPLAVAMIPIINHLGMEGVPTGILWWALIFGVGYGGHGTPIGSAANLVAVAQSEQNGTPITLKIWLKTGMASMIICLIVGTIALLVMNKYIL